MVNEQVILETVRRIEEGQADMDRSMEKDRQHIQNLDVRMSGVESQIEELRKAINLSSERIKNKVQGVVDPVIESTDRLTTQIEKKKMVVLKWEAKSWWQKFWGKGVSK